MKPLLFCLVKRYSFHKRENLYQKRFYEIEPRKKVLWHWHHDAGDEQIHLEIKKTVLNRMLFTGRHDTQNNDIQHNDTQNNI